MTYNVLIGTLSLNTTTTTTTTTTTNKIAAATLFALSQSNELFLSMVIRHEGW